MSCSQYDISLQNSSYIIASSCSWANILLACPTTVSNVLLIMALATSRDRSKPCTILLLNLAITDLITGIFSMPLFFIFFRYTAEHKSVCYYAKAVVPFALANANDAFFIVALIAMERYIKVFHPFFHSSKLSSRNVAVCISVSWVVSILVIVPLITGAAGSKYDGYVGFILVLVMFLNIVAYLRILSRARKVKLQIQNEAARFGHTSFNPTDKRYMIIGGLVLVSGIICFMPLAVGNFLWILGFKNENLRKLRCWEWNLLMANSLINPFITCSFWPDIRRKIHRVLTCRVFCNETN